MNDIDFLSSCQTINRMLAQDGRDTVEPRYLRMWVSGGESMEELIKIFNQIISDDE